MRIWLLTLLLSCTGTIIFAQDAETSFSDFGNWKKEGYNINESDTAYVFTNNSNVRLLPSINSEIIGKLPIGSKLIIKERTSEFFSLNGLRSNWLKIKCDTIEGFIWGGVLTTTYLPVSKDKQLFWGVTLYKSTDSSLICKIALRLVKDGRLLNEIVFNPKYASEPKYGRLTRFDNPKLDFVESVIVYETLADACGVYSSESNFLLINNELRFVGTGFAMGDGGVLFDVTTFKFPFENNDTNLDFHYIPEENRMLKVVSVGSYDDDCIWVETNKVYQFEWKEGDFQEFCDY